jgi:hypothetical protein
LPETFALSRLDCTEDALLVYDSLGRVASLEWRDVWMIASGKVTVQEFHEVATPLPDRIHEAGFKIMKHFDGRLTFTDLRRTGGKHPHWEVRPVDHTTREAAHDRHLLEIFLTGGIRYSINADKAPLLFTYLADRRTKDLSHNFNLVVQDLVRHAPHAALNRGANSAAENPDLPFFYPNKIAFYHELIWLLWLASRIQPTEPPETPTDA